MADWAADVKKYAPDADDAVIAKIVRHCGIALQKADSSLVSFSDQAELDRVKKGFMTKKLEIPADKMDEGLAAVKEKMKADRTKDRVTVYYLLAEHYGKLGIFS
ncbi:MAG TPA: DUF2853 family protein [Dermatophilaceae bacterium]|nr:DUF2853 family protein [Dermatophilaceae bacterium]